MNWWWKKHSFKAVRGSLWRRSCSRWPKAERKTNWNENTNHAMLHLLRRVPQHRCRGETREGEGHAWIDFNFIIFEFSSMRICISCLTQIQFNESTRPRWSEALEFICRRWKRNKLWRQCSSVWQLCFYWFSLTWFLFVDSVIAQQAAEQNSILLTHCCWCCRSDGNCMDDISRICTMVCRRVLRVGEPGWHSCLHWNLQSILSRKTECRQQSGNFHVYAEWCEIKNL